MEQFQVSVIIPVYNAEKFVPQAVESALAQPETAEVLLVEDHSPDDSLRVCEELAGKYPAVKLHRHENGENRGAAASRNLGIRKAGFPYVSFLDADDYYLPGRFAKTKDIFLNNEGVDGVYEAIGATFEDEEVKKFFTSVGLREITTIKREVAPGELFGSLLGCTNGYFHFNGFTARRGLFSKVSFFDEDVESIGPHEDTMLMYKLSAKASLFPGNLTQPVAVRRVHQENRITYRLGEKRKTYEAMLDFWKMLLAWGEVNLTKEQMVQLEHRVILHLRGIDSFEEATWADFCLSRVRMFQLAIQKPDLFTEYLFWRRLVPSRDLVNSRIGKWKKAATYE